MTQGRESKTHLKPLFFGRLTRIVFGVAVLYWGVGLWGADLGSFVASLYVIILGLSFLVGGLYANPGCELTALPNLALPSEKRLHCF